MDAIAAAATRCPFVPSNRQPSSIQPFVHPPPLRSFDAARPIVCSPLPQPHLHIADHSLRHRRHSSRFDPTTAPSPRTPSDAPPHCSRLPIRSAPPTPKARIMSKAVATSRSRKHGAMEDDGSEDLSLRTAAEATTTAGPEHAAAERSAQRQTKPHHSSPRPLWSQPSRRTRRLECSLCPSR